MKQIWLASAGFELAPKRTRKRELLDEMNQVVPWTTLIAWIVLHDVPLYREFAGLDAAINTTLAGHGLMLKTGTVVDATLIAAPTSTKNKSGERDAGYQGAQRWSTRSG
jgi:IS5 family transposase